MLKKLIPTALCLGLLLPHVVRAGEETSGGLSVVPSDAVAFLWIPSLKDLDGNYQRAIKDLELQGMVMPPMNSIVGMIKQNLPMFQGIDEAGALALVLMPFDVPAEINAKTAMVMPATDPKAMVQKMGGQEAEGGIWSVNLMGTPGFAAIRGKHLVVGQTADLVKAIGDSKKGMDSALSATDKKSLEGVDIALWANAERILTTLKPMIMPLMNMAMMAQPGTSAFESTAMKMNQHNIESLVDGMSTVCIGLGLPKTGLVLRFAGSAKPGSELGEQWSFKNTTASLLRGIPSGDYMLALGNVVNPEQTKASMSQLDTFFDALGSSESIDAEKMKKLQSHVRSWAMATTGTRMCAEALPPGEHGLFGLSVIADTSDSAKWIESAQQAFNLAKEIVNEAATKKMEGEEEKSEDLEEIQELIGSFSVTADTAEVAGAKVTEFRFDLKAIDALSEDDLDDVTRLIGKDGALIRMAAANGKSVAITFGGGSDYLAKVIDATRSENAPLESSEGIQRVAPLMPKERYTLGYVSLQNILKAVKNVAKVMEEDPFPAEIPSSTPPIGMAAAGGDGWSRFDVVIPTELIIAVKNAAMMMMAPPPPSQPAMPTPPTGE